MIERARLDGSGRQVVLAQTERVQWPNHMIINDEYPHGLLPFSQPTHSLMLC